MNSRFYRGAIGAVIGGVMGFALGGCTLVTQGATESRDEFSATFQCPTDRVEVFGPEQVYVRPPPPEVASDPARLKIWTDEVTDTTSNTVLFRVTGCDHSAAYQCQKEATTDGHVVIGCSGEEDGLTGVAYNTRTRAIVSVKAGSLAEKAGMRVDDILMAVDHQPVVDGIAFGAAMKVANPAGHVVTLNRGGQMIDVTVPTLQ